MRKFIIGLCLAMILLPNAMFSQGSWLDATNVVGNGNVTITDMEVDLNGDYFIMGWFDTNIISTAGSIVSKGNYDIFLLKVNSDGTHAWLKGFGGIFPDLPGGVEIGPDGSIYVSGSVNGTVFFDATTSITTTAVDAFLANFDPDGTLNWVKTVAGGPKNQRSEAMRIDNDKIILSGLAVDSVIYDDIRIGYAGKFAHLSTYDLDGNHLLNNTIGFKDVGLPTSIAATTDGYLISGYFRDSLFLDIGSLRNQSTTPSSDIYLYKVDKDLKGQWVRRTTSTFGENVPYSVRFDGVDDIYMVGKTASLDLKIDSTDTESLHIIRTTGGDEYFIFNYLNGSGALDWYTINGTNRGEALWDLKILPDRLVSTGYYGADFDFGNDTLVNQTLNRKILVTEHDLNGNLIHARDAYSEPLHYYDQGYRLGINLSNEIVIAGTYRSEIINFENTQFSNSSPGSSNIFVATYGCKGDGSLSTSSSNLMCYNDYSGVINVTASGGFTNPHYGHEYDVFLDNGVTVFNRKISSPGVINGLPAGIYSITVYDNANCMIGTSNETLDQPDSLQYTYEVVHPNCDAEVSGSITIADPQGGVAPYRYSINCGTDFQTDPIFINLPAGNYCIIMEDANGCQTPALDTTLVAPATLTFEFDLINDSLKCFGNTDSEIHFKNVQGGSGGYIYSIDGGASYQADTFFLGLTGGAYQLIVSDINLCASMVVDTTIFQPAEIIPYFSVNDTLCYGLTGEIVFDSVSGGFGSLMYSINNGTDFGTEITFSDLPGGDYQLLVRDDSLCASTITDVSIIILDEFIIDNFSSENISSTGDGSIEVVVSGGFSPYTYILNPGAVGPNDDGIFTISNAGTYTVEINDTWNCGPITTDPITIISTVDIEDYLFVDAMVYPNPSRGEITIEMKLESSRSTIEVMSLTGQVVSSAMVYPTGGQLKETLHLSDLAKGMYMLRVDGKMLRSAIVLQ